MKVLLFDPLKSREKATNPISSKLLNFPFSVTGNAELKKKSYTSSPQLPSCFVVVTVVLTTSVLASTTP